MRTKFPIEVGLASFACEADFARASTFPGSGRKDFWTVINKSNLNGDPAPANSLPPDRLLDEVSELVWCLTRDWQRVSFMNRSAQALFGDAAGQVRKTDRIWMGVIHPGDKPYVVEQLERIESAGDFQQSFRVLKPNGEERSLDARFKWIAEHQSIAVFAQDSSERIAAQQGLIEAKAVHDSLVENLPIKVFRKNRQGRFVFCNQTFAEGLGLTPDQVVGRTDADLFPEDLARKYRQDDLAIMESGQPYHGVEIHPAPDGRPTWVEVIKSPLREKDGRRIGIQGLFWDVTDRVVAEKQLREARDLAEKATRVRGDFMANVSHEIRTPMNGIVGLTELLLESVRDKNHREYLGMIRQSADGLMTLINDILDFSKIESGKLELDVRRFDLRSLLGEAVRALAVKAHSKKLELVVDMDSRVPCEVIGDPSRLRQVITNLVGNAIKFTHEGSVVVRIGNVSGQSFLLPASGETETGKFRFEVQDTGIGIPSSKLEKIFTEFEQADSSTTREYGGTGLGLSIAREIVRLMNGDIEVASKPGEGSIFSFEIELPVVELESQLGRTCREQFSGMRVVIVDDRQVAIDATSRLVEKWGMEFSAVSTVDSLLEELQRLGNELAFPAFILIDESLPGQSIEEVIEKVRGLSELASQPPHLITMADFQPAGVLGSGEVDRIHKPVLERELGMTMMAILGVNSGTTGIVRKEHAPSTSRRIRVLLAEDNAVNQRVATAMLEKLDCTVEIAQNGQEAIDSVAKGNFDVVLMDVQMPLIDGIEATRSIRRLENAGARVRIIGLSAHASAEHRSQCLAAGMNDYISKPFRKNELAAAIRPVEETGQSAGRLEAETEVSEINVDWEHAMETVGGDRQLLGDIIGVFVDDVPRQIDNILASIAARDTASLRRQTHSLKGALGYLGANKSLKLVCQLEDFALSDQIEGSESLAKSLAVAVEELTTELLRFKNS